MTQTLAEANRPQLWSELVGQEWAKNALQAAILNNQVKPGYLFEGLTGCGKTTAALILAKRLLCSDPHGADPCNKCLACEQVDRRTNQNFEHINAANDRSLEFVREHVIPWLRLGPIGANHRVMIIDEAHAWPRASISPFLIELERMPKRSHVIFCTTESESMLPEIRNRCQAMLFGRLSSSVVADQVKATLDIDVDQTTLELLVEECGGSFRQVWSAIEAFQTTNSKLTSDVIHTLLNALPARDRKRLWADLSNNNLAAAAKRWRGWMSQGINPARVGRHLLNDLIEMVANNPVVDWTKPLAVLSGITVQNNPDLWLPAILSIGGYPYNDDFDITKPADVRKYLFG